MLYIKEMTVSHQPPPQRLLTELYTVGNLHHEQPSQWVTALRMCTHNIHTYSVHWNTCTCVCIHTDRGLEYVWSCEVKLRNKRQKIQNQIIWLNLKVDASQAIRTGLCVRHCGLEYANDPSQQHAHTYTLK